MAPITQFSQLDLTKTYTYADYLTWKFNECVELVLYKENGVREYWLVYPGLKTSTAYVLAGEEYQLAGEYIEPGPMPAATLPGLMVEWVDIFDRQ